MSQLQNSLASSPASFESRPAKRRIRSAARQALNSTIEEGRRAYDRRKALAPFYRLSKETIETETVEAAGKVLREIARALRAERARMRHWSYDLNRHIGLMIAYRCEKSRADRIARRGENEVKGRNSRPVK